MAQPHVLLPIACALSLALSAAAAAAQVDGFAVVNKAGGAISGLLVRRVGSDEWLPLQAAPADGASAQAAFRDVDCAFDLRATVAGAGPVTWNGVNLCGAKSLTLNRDSAGRAWVDYE